MAIIPQKSLFKWTDVENLGDLCRLQYVTENVPDEALMRKLEKKRGKGRDDFPVRAMWNSLMAMIVFQHGTVESLRRELSRNGQLREVCGFDHFRTNPVPSSSAYTRFIVKLMKNTDEVHLMLDALVRLLQEELPDFGSVLGIDGKALSSRSRRRSLNLYAGFRGEHDADWGVKKYYVKKPDGTKELKHSKWFGFKAHTVSDCTYELPVAFTVTEASRAEQPESSDLLDHLEDKHPGLLKRTDYFLGDKGYDGTWLHTRLWDDHGIKPVIALRNMWKESEGNDCTRKVSSLQNVSYDFEGNVYCYDKRGGRHGMAFGGFEKDRNTLKFRCPARHYNETCPNRDSCPVGTAVRIPLREDRRVFTPLARQSYKWKDLYDKRSATERIHSRLDESFGFEKHTIRGKVKMELRIGMAYLAMLSMALGRIKDGQSENIRSLVKTA